MRTLYGTSSLTLRVGNLLIDAFSSNISLSATPRLISILSRLSPEETISASIRAMSSRRIMFLSASVVSRLICLKHYNNHAH